MRYEPLSERAEEIAHEVIDSAYCVHSKLGPGLLECVYEKCMLYELHKRGLRADSQRKVPIVYDGIHIDADLKLDIIVENEIVVELKVVESIMPVHEAQLLTYLKLTESRLGFLINFNTDLIKNGIKRIIL